MTRVGVFEDEPIIQLLWENLAIELGFEVVGIGQTLEEGAGLARVADMDIAILDIHMHGEYSDVILNILEERNIPVLVCSGIASPDVPQSFQRHEMLEKPFTASIAQRKLESVLSATMLIG